MAHRVAAADAIPVMAFYGLEPKAWDAVPHRDRQRMLATVPYFRQIALRTPDDAQVRALDGWRAKLAWTEAYVDVEHEARRAVCMMEAMTVGDVFRRLKAELAMGRTVVETHAPAFRHPQHWALVELLQRALVTIELHQELGANGADGLTADQVERVREAARGAGQVHSAYQVPHGVADLLVALKPVMVWGAC